MPEKDAFGNQLYICVEVANRQSQIGIVHQHPFARIECFSERRRGLWAVSQQTGRDRRRKNGEQQKQNSCVSPKVSPKTHLTRNGCSEGRMRTKESSARRDS
jgi:hypothetical protein